MRFNRSNSRSPGHLAPGRHFPLEIVRSLGLGLDHHVEADGLHLLLRLWLPHDRIDLGIEFRDHRIGCLSRHKEADPGAGIDIGEAHLAVSRHVRHRRVAGRARQADAAQEPLRDGRHHRRQCQHDRIDMIADRGGHRRRAAGERHMHGLHFRDLAEEIFRTDMRTRSNAGAAVGEALRLAVRNEPR